MKLNENDNSPITFGAWQAFYLLLAFLVLGLIGQFVTIFLFQVLHGLSPYEISTAINDNNSLINWHIIVTSQYAQSLIGGYAVFWLTRRWAKPLFSVGTPYGMGLTNTTTRGVIWAIGVGLFTVVIAYYGLFVLFLPADIKDKWLNEPLNVLLQQSNYLGFITRFHLVIITPLVEEFLFRGAIFSALSRARGVKFAFIATSIIFIILHIENFDYWLGLVSVGLVSVGLIILRLRFGSLIPCIIAHSVYNVSLLLLLFY